MNSRGHRLALGIGLFGLACLFGCATPAVVFVSPDYGAQNIQRVSVQGFNDAPGQPGSGTQIADVFEKSFGRARPSNQADGGANTHPARA